MTRDTATPLMQQYREIKSRHEDAILFFRMGDFYEMFYEDAQTASRVLGLTLTSRNNGGAAEVPLAGVPAKALNDYLRRLVRQGFRVAICEQVEDPKLAKGVVRREVTETITPGAAFNDDLLDGAANNFLCAACVRGGRVGLAAADLSTGEFTLCDTTLAEAAPVLARLSPRELLVARGGHEPPSSTIAGTEGALVTERDAWEFDAAMAHQELTRHFGVQSLEGFGIDDEHEAAVGAAGALLRYLRELQPGGLPHLARPVLDRPGGTIPLDEMTRRNLELVESLRGGETAGTLLDVLDRTLTPMGARLLRQWILAPLAERTAIEARHSAVERLVRAALARAGLREALDGVRDVERLASKVAAARATPRELGALGASLARLPRVVDAMRGLGESGVATAGTAGTAEVGEVAEGAEGVEIAQDTGALAPIIEQWDDCADLAARIGSMLVERPPVQIGDEATIRDGVDRELDEVRALRDGGKDAIARIQAEERERTGIASLKVGFNRVFGYFIEITNSNKHLVPSDYQRRQTLTGAERFVTPALKEYEERVLTAAERIETRERTLFEAVRAEVGASITRLQRVARAIATLDVLASLAEAAAREGYTRPVMHDGYELEIIAGRHPVVERMMPREKFIPNDLRLVEDARMIILTGPNMAGKSTILRQAGLIVLMAQMGSFVPAERARLGLVDRVFTRVGASDNLVRGQSTFMVEMSETSAILHTATRRSLVLLDEIGRGTSTYDGVSIAWAVSEHLHDRLACKTVFATHYHELTQLAVELDAVRNYNVAVREVSEPLDGTPRVLFLHRLQPGGADRSYGIEVGRLAGLPEPVLQRARAVLRLLEGEGERLVPSLARAGRGVGGGRTASTVAADQLALFGSAEHPVVDRLRGVDPNAMTPLQALELLARLVEEAKGDGA